MPKCEMAEPVQSACWRVAAQRSLATKSSHDMVMNMVTKNRGGRTAQISAAEFKATCLDLMDEVDRSGTPIVVTKRGRAVAQLAPVRARVRSAFGLLKGRIVIRGSIIDPIDVTWNANK
jgi:prevent-host-death family protein